MRHCIFFGDSITDANHLFSSNPLGDGYLLELSKLASASGTPLCLRNQGHNGHTLQKLISMFHSVWNHGRFHTDPYDVAAIQIGINDVSVCQNTLSDSSKKEAYLLQYREQLHGLLAEIRSDFAGPIFLLEPFLFPIPEEFQTWLPMRARFSSVMADVGETFGCTFLPLQSLLVEMCMPSRFSLLTTDGIHLTHAGNRLLASFLWDQIERWVKNS